jgi:hypothetical protein
VSDEARPESPEAEPQPELDEAEEARLRALLRGALAEPPAAEVAPDLLRGVQKKLRQRSRGKFYADGWSTEEQEPIVLYLYTSVFMLAAIVVLWFALSTSKSEPVPVHNEPAPVQVVPGPRR